MSDNAYYTLCGVLIAGILAGIALMSRVKSAARGNALSALCMALAIALTLWHSQLFSDLGLLACVAASTALGLLLAARARMIDMPQLVGLLNGFGGAASALVAAVGLLDGLGEDAFVWITAALALATGMFTLTGSLVAAGKLHRLLPQKPAVWPAYQGIVLLCIALTAIGVIAMPFASGALISVLVWALFAVSGFFGVAFAMRIGGADMPITISLLNALSGLAGAIAGMFISDPLLVAVGGIVGASGLFLTQTMCQSMNRRLGDILLGKTVAAAHPAQPAAAAEKAPAPPKEEPDLGALFAKAKRVILVPGYGMALAQAQALVKQLFDLLEAKGIEVLFAIHPVAGRMPGHMNVLLCEVDIPYEQLREMDEINPLFAECDIAVIIGANDVVNPAANTAEGTPIYGLPILRAGEARHVVICNYDLKPGYAGVENPLYEADHVTLLLGDANKSLQALMDQIR